MSAEALVADAVLLHTKGHDPFGQAKSLCGMPHMAFIACQSFRNTGTLQFIQTFLQRTGCHEWNGVILFRSGMGRAMDAMEFSGKMLGQNKSFLTNKENGSFYDVFQFADIARPVVSLEHIHNGKRKTYAMPFAGRGVLVDEMNGKRLDVFCLSRRDGIWMGKTLRR